MLQEIENMADGQSDVNAINKNPPIDGKLTRKINYQVDYPRNVS